jgi:hypothetical protein
MNMKRFLILFSLIAFVTVSCAGPNKVRWTKPDFRQDQFENDRKDCSDSIDKNLDSEAFGKALEECLEKEGYEFKKAEEPPSGNKVTAKDIGLVALLIALSPLIIAYGILLIGRAP